MFRYLHNISSVFRHSYYANNFCFKAQLPMYKVCLNTRLPVYNVFLEAQLPGLHGELVLFLVFATTFRVVGLIAVWKVAVHLPAQHCNYNM